MTDIFADRGDAVHAPATRVRAVAPNDVAALPIVPKALYVGSGGSVTLRALNDDADSQFANVPAGSVLPVRATHVRATGTSAGAILALG